MRWKLYIDEKGRDEWRAPAEDVVLRVKKSYGRMACGPSSAWCAINYYPDVEHRLVGTYADAKTAKHNASRALRFRRKVEAAGDRISQRVGDWHLSWEKRHPNLVFVDFEPPTLRAGRAAPSVQQRRSQSGLLYDSGDIAWDFPELVPSSVESGVRALFERLVAAGLTRTDPNFWLWSDGED